MFHDKVKAQDKKADTAFMPSAAAAPAWVREWSDAWRSGIGSALDSSLARAVDLDKRTSKDDGLSPWWFAGVETIIAEPRTHESGQCFYAHLWPQRTPLGERGLTLEVVSAPGKGTLMSLVSLRVSHPSEVEHVGHEMTHGLQQAWEWLMTTDTETLYAWAGGSDPLLRKVAETAPALSSAARVVVFLRDSDKQSLFYPPPPSVPLHCSRAFFSRTLTTSVLLNLLGVRIPRP